MLFSLQCPPSSVEDSCIVCMMLALFERGLVDASCNAQLSFHLVGASCYVPLFRMTWLMQVATDCEHGLVDSLTFRCVIACLGAV